MKESKENCIFCKILEGNAPVSMIYADKKIAVFPVLEPVNKGHVIIIPRQHSPYMNDVDDRTLEHIMRFAKKLNQALRESKYRCEGVNLFVADGEAAHQEVFHFHLHVYPRFKGDGFGFKYDKSKHFIETERKELDEVAEEIKRNLN